ncbi:MAG TPA: hypothetical protein PLV68_20565, partial [Ilumatobacteraceae bacterium]|nr:hypothetical protein [Ilumatobacteraceae bacterium]
TPPPRARIDESMEALIHHFKIFTEGFKVPEGETYVSIESPRGEIGIVLRVIAALDRELTISERASTGGDDLLGHVTGTGPGQ